MQALSNLADAYLLSTVSGFDRPSIGFPPLPAVVGGRFELMELLGRGNMGEVYLAEDRYTDLSVALKVTTRHGTRAHQRFRREGLIASAFDLPGLPKVVATGSIGMRPYLVYELVRGACTLDYVFHFTQFRRRLEIVRDVAKLLGHVHLRGVVHRDVKPENILIDMTGQIHLCDFGLASAVGLPRLSPASRAVGTPLAMAPEQVCGEVPTPATDVWAVGVLLYQALTNEFPFDGETWSELRDAIIRAEPTPPSLVRPDVPPALEAICLKALRGDPGRRYSSGSGLARDLSRYLHGGLPRLWLRLAGPRLHWSPFYESI
jgi:eukaryotic-like serine/threonine-protein kinase